MENKITGTVVENGVYRNLYKNFDSPYLLPDVIRKFKAKDKELKFDKIYFDDLIDERRKKLLETRLTTFYAEHFHFWKKEVACCLTSVSLCI